MKTSKENYCSEEYNAKLKTKSIDQYDQTNVMLKFSAVFAPMHLAIAVFMLYISLSTENPMLIANDIDLINKLTVLFTGTMSVVFGVSTLFLSAVFIRALNKFNSKMYKLGQFFNDEILSQREKLLLKEQFCINELAKKHGI